jgi:protein required for attachment to host cells
MEKKTANWKKNTEETQRKMMTALTAAKRIDHLNKISKNQERYSVPHNQISKFSTNSRSQEDRLQREIAQHAADKVINNQLLHKDHKALHLQMEKENINRMKL